MLYTQALNPPDDLNFGHNSLATRHFQSGKRPTSICDGLTDVCMCVNRNTVRRYSPAGFATLPFSQSTRNQNT